MRFLYALLGYNRAGKIFYTALLVLGVPAVLWTLIERPRAHFRDVDERLFAAALQGDIAGVERSIDDGADVNVPAPSDGRTALFRAAVFGHADLVRVLVTHGADVNARGADGRTALDLVTEARQEEKDPARAEGLDAVAAALRESRK